MQGSGWHTCGIVKISMDKGHTWGPVVPLREEPGWVVRTKPIVLREGDFLIPAYDEREWKPAFFISEDEGRPNKKAPCPLQGHPAGGGATFRRLPLGLHENQVQQDMGDEVPRPRQDLDRLASHLAPQPQCRR
ncbi:MAG TPA: hypothetical protein EYP65_07275 [Armatimonadetes bacterium]|nr:hypothetical protein [Armatimonadota bacterium]